VSVASLPHPRHPPAADTFPKVYEYSNYALAAAVPVAALSSRGSALEKAADWTLAAAIPVHLHLTTNAVVSDYVPTAVRGAPRCAALPARAPPPFSRSRRLLRCASQRLLLRAFCPRCCCCSRRRAAAG